MRWEGSMNAADIRNQSWFGPLTHLCGNVAVVLLKKGEKIDSKSSWTMFWDWLWSPGAAIVSRTSRSSCRRIRYFLVYRRYCRSGAATSILTLSAQKDGLRITPTSTLWTSLFDPTWRSRGVLRTSVDSLKESSLKAWEEISMGTFTR